MKRFAQIFTFLAALYFCASVFAATADETTPAATASAIKVERVRAYRDGEMFSTELQTSATWQVSEGAIQFIADAVQIDFTGATLAGGKQIIKVDDRVFRSVYVAQPEPGTVRARLNLKAGYSAASIQNQLHIRHSAAGITIEVAGEAKSAKNFKADPISRTIAIEEDMKSEEFGTNKLVAGAPKTDSTAATAAATAAVNLAMDGKPGEAKADVKPDSKLDGAETKKIDTAKLNEKEIPVLAAIKETKKSQGSPFTRILLTLGVIVFALGGLTYGLKRWSANAKGTNINAKIRVLTQHHIGPKKSIAIIQVAGESILVGITDHNISMLKTLSLIDDEVPEVSGRDFHNTLDGFEDGYVDEPDVRQAVQHASQEAARRAPVKNQKKQIAAPKREATREQSREPAREPEDFAMRGISEIRDVVSNRLKNMRNF